jgi:hypothetical protein
VFYDHNKRRLLMDCAHQDSNCQGIYRKLRVKEVHNLIPDDTFRIGSLEFHNKRFNSGVHQDIGQRKSMEDTYC